jgi:two-component system chemotaxis response regulator CheY
VSERPKPRAVSASEQGALKVLVVDDESNMRLLIRMILESAGYEVVEAAHGAAALMWVKASRFDLVVTDLMMPVMSGRELVERLRADPGTASIPIMVVSASSSSVATKADVTLGKPFEPFALLEAATSLAGSGGG